MVFEIKIDQQDPSLSAINCKLFKIVVSVHRGFGSRGFLLAHTYLPQRNNLPDSCDRSEWEVILIQAHFQSPSSILNKCLASGSFLIKSSSLFFIKEFPSIFFVEPMLSYFLNWIWE